MIPKAESFINNYKSQFSAGSIPTSNILINFAKLHVEAALKAASENAETEEYMIPGVFYVNIDSILNAYPLENIK